MRKYLKRFALLTAAPLLGGITRLVMADNCPKQIYDCEVCLAPVSVHVTFSFGGSIYHGTSVQPSVSYRNCRGSASMVPMVNGFQDYEIVLIDRNNTQITVFYFVPSTKENGSKTFDTPPDGGSVHFDIALTKQPNP